MRKLILILTIFYFYCFSLQLSSKPSDLNLWPKPANVQKNCDSKVFYGICNLIFNFNAATISDDTYEILQVYQKIIFNRQCPNSTIKLNSLESTMTNSLYQQEGLKENMTYYTIDINVFDFNHQVSNDVKDEEYHINLSEEKGKITTLTYVGFVRALETLSQLVKYEPRVTKLILDKLPILIDDIPSFYHRGIMIDTARHFLSKETILKTIDGLMYNKMSVLHWHISDAESFPLELESFPQLTRNAIYGPDQYYSIKDVKEIVKYAHIRGIKIMPEIDTPGHARCWSFPDYEEIAMGCWKYGNGQLDPTKPKTWEVLKGIFIDINNLFPDNIVHFGGDEVQLWCWDERPEIKTWMDAHGIADYEALEAYYKSELKKLWKTITENKPKESAFWQNAKLVLDSDPTEIIQWWGKSDELDKIKDLPNRVILSFHDSAYFDHFDLTWEKVLTFEPVQPNIKGTIIGGEGCLWSEKNNDDTQELKLWIRGSALAERLWNTKAQAESTQADILKRLTGMESRLRKRGLRSEPTYKQYCQDDPYYCYPDKNDQVQEIQEAEC